MNLEQVDRKAFVKESKMFEVNFNRRCTNKFSQTFHKEKLDKEDFEVNFIRTRLRSV